jgi:hypothetical protein
LTLPLRYSSIVIIKSGIGPLRRKKMSTKAEELLIAAGIESLKNVSVPVALWGEIQDARAFIEAAKDRPRLAAKVAAKAAWLMEAEAEFSANGWKVY